MPRPNIQQGHWVSTLSPSSPAPSHLLPSSSPFSASSSCVEPQLNYTPCSLLSRRVKRGSLGTAAAVLKHPCTIPNSLPMDKDANI